MSQTTSVPTATTTSTAATVTTALTSEHKPEVKISERLAQLKETYKPSINQPKTPVSNVSKTPARHMAASPTSEAPRRSAALATPYTDDENSDDEPTVGRTKKFNQLEGWPSFPSFIDGGIDGRYLDVLVYMMVGPKDYGEHQVDKVRLAVSTFWENERELYQIQKQGRFNSSKAKERLNNRTRLINSLVRDGFGLDETSINVVTRD